MKYVLLIMILLVGCSTTPAEPTPLPTIVPRILHPFPTATSTPEEKAELERRINELLIEAEERRKNQPKEDAINALIDALGGEYLTSCILEEREAKYEEKGWGASLSPDWSEVVEVEMEIDDICRAEVEKAIDWESLERQLTDQIRRRMGSQ